MTDGPSSPILESGAFFAQRFSISRRLRSDSFQSVYLAKDQLRGEQEVQLTVFSNKVSSNLSLVASLARDLRAALLANSPHILQCLDFDCLCATPYYISEHVSGATLDSLIGQSRALAIPEAINITRETLRGLKALHEVGLIHGGLSPESILISDKGQIKLLSSGCLPLFQHMRESISTAPTSLHLSTAPEILEGEAPTIRSDIYSIGLVAYQLIVGENPFLGLALSELKAKKSQSNPNPPHHRASDCPDNLSAAIMRACAAPSAIRFTSAPEMLSTLDQISPAPPDGFQKNVGLSKLRVIDLPLFLLSSTLPANLRPSLSPLESAMRQVQTIPAVIRTLLGAIIVALFSALAVLLPSSQQLQPPVEVVEEAPLEAEPTKVPLYPAYLVSNLFDLEGRIIFASGQEGRRAILLLHIAAKEVLPLIDDEFDNFDPAISSDSRTLAFVSTREGEPAIFTFDLHNPGVPTKVKNSLGLRYPSFSPDNTFLVASKDVPASDPKEPVGSELYQIEIATGELKPLTKFGGKNYSPAWNPIANQIAFTTDRYWPGSDICVWDILRTSEECIRTGHANYLRPSWDRTGKRLVSIRSGEGASNAEIYDFESGKIKILGSGTGSLLDPAFAPNSPAVVAVRSSPDAQQSSLLVFNGLEQEREILLAPDQVRTPRWIK